MKNNYIKVAGNKAAEGMEGGKELGDARKVTETAFVPVKIAASKMKGSMFKILGYTAFKYLLLIMKEIFKYTLLILALCLAGMLVVAAPILVMLMSFYHSPFSFFLPKVQNTETVTEVVEGYYREFTQDIIMEIRDWEDYDYVEIVYDYSPPEYKYLDPIYAEVPDSFYNSYQGNLYEMDANFKDVIVTYMVKYGGGADDLMDIATVMDKKGKKKLRSVFKDMVSYSISSYSYETVLCETVLDEEGMIITDETGNAVTRTYEKELKVKLIRIMRRNASYMAVQYSFDENEKYLLKKMEELYEFYSEG